MADKPVKLTDAQLTTLRELSDATNDTPPDTYPISDLRQLQAYGLIKIYYELEGSRVTNVVRGIATLSKGRAHLDSLGIAPVALQPPPKTDKERIAELEAALQLCKTQAYEAWQQAIGIQKNGGSAGGVFNVAREGLVDVIETVKSVLGSEE